MPRTSKYTRLYEQYVETVKMYKYNLGWAYGRLEDDSLTDEQRRAYESQINDYEKAYGPLAYLLLESFTAAERQEIESAGYESHKEARAAARRYNASPENVNRAA